MIQEFFHTTAQALLPNYVWTIDYYVEASHNASVYYEGGGAPSTYEDALRFPNYMIHLSSENWEQTEKDTETLLKTFHGVQNQTFTTSGGKTFEIIYIQAQGEPQRLGVIEEKMEYTINFNSIIREVI